MKEEEQINLYARYEARVLASAVPEQQEVPACVITGFLGSGKTTLVSHLLRHRGGLRMAVLINEVGAVDLDSQLVDVAHVHAAQGLPAPSDMQAQGASLAGGCVCCSASGGLEASLALLRERSLGAFAGGGIEYLVVETSGVADAEPVAHVLTKHGFHLEAVVAVVDAEAGAATLLQPVAQAQVRCADVVVVNKCDLAGLGSAADVEDQVQRLSPGVRMVRARFGQVPLPALLDVEPISTPLPPRLPLTATTTKGGDHGHPKGEVDKPATAPDIRGEVGFLSHEANLTGPQQQGMGFRVAGRLSKLVGTKALQKQEHQPASANNGHGGHSHQHDHHDHHHHHQQGHDASMHEGFHTVAVLCDQPVPLRGLQAFAATLVRLPGVLRAKGIVWVRELRSHSWVLHLSGRQRVECLRGDPWPGPPATQLVLIGTDLPLLSRLKLLFLELATAAPEAPEPPQPPQSAGEEREVRVMWRCAEQVQATLADLHEQFEVVVRPEPTDTAGGASQTTSSTTSSIPLLQLRVRGEPLHGVRGSEVAAGLLRRLNAALPSRAGLLALGVPEPPAISGVTGGATHGVGERMEALLLLPDPSNPLLLRAARGCDAGNGAPPPASRIANAVRELASLVPFPPEAQPATSPGDASKEEDAAMSAAAAVVQLVQGCSVPALRQAFLHQGCRCDVVAAMRAA